MGARRQHLASPTGSERCAPVEPPTDWSRTTNADTGAVSGSAVTSACSGATGPEPERWTAHSASAAEHVGEHPERIELACVLRRLLATTSQMARSSLLSDGVGVGSQTSTTSFMTMLQA